MKIGIQFRDLRTKEIVAADAFPADARLERRTASDTKTMHNFVVVTEEDDRGYQYDVFVGVQVYPCGPDEHMII